MKKTWITAILLCLSVTPAFAAEELSFENAVKTIDGRFEPAEAKPGETVTFRIQVLLNKGFHTYPTVQSDPKASAIVDKIQFPVGGDIIFVEPVQDPPFEVKMEGDFKQLRYYPGGVTWEIPAIVSPKATKGEKTITLPRFQILICDKSNCLPPKRIPISAKLNILEGSVEVASKYKDLVERAINGIVQKKDSPPPQENVAPENTTAHLTENKNDEVFLIAKDRDYARDLAAVKGMLPNVETDNAGFLAFVLTAMFWGLVTLLTPCVFPMVPITVSYFLKQGEKKQHNPIAMAFAYTLTIIVVLGVAALFFLATFRELSINPWMNVALGGLFIVFALSLFGMYDIVLPSFLVRFTSSREGKGGYGGVIFMALSFSIVSFTCVAPFLGGFAGMAASGKFSSLQLAAGAVAFAAAFASPFFLLALFPTMLKKMPKSGSWMNTIKVVMGFVELAAALKFLRTAELRWTAIPSIFTYDFVLSVWVVILFVAGLYLLNLYRLPHDEPQEHIGVPRMMAGLIAISVGLYLLPGLFAIKDREKQRPAGQIYAWVDAFLLPEPDAVDSSGNGLKWSGDLRAVIENAREHNQVVFVDFTGKTCVNCKLNENNVFPQPQVNELLKKYRLVQMFTDEVPARYYAYSPTLDKQENDAELNLKFQREVFRDEKLPLYTLLRPEPGPVGSPVKILGIYGEGKINDVNGFVAFLKKGEGK
jgi:thiol:disulfide interchange protein DsbD